jgi:tetratricopeptide (TPR) repeat protein
MNTPKFILSLVAVVCTMSAVGQSSDAVIRDKMTSAVMKVYDDHLAQNPNDYNILFARAHQNFYNGDYTAALADVNQALMLTPKTDKELRFDEYILRARISDARHDYQSELTDLKLAQELQPKSLPCTDFIAKANLKLGNLDAAEKAFKTILRAESMNYDAMYGLAQVEQARGNNKAALDHVTKALDLFRVEPQVYVNRADIYTRQGNIEAAVKDLLDGMAVGSGGTAAKALFDLSDINYDGVMRSLASIADNAGENAGIYRYLRANLAIDHSRYGQALKDLNNIRRTHLYNSPSVDYNIAKCYMELGRYDEAINMVDQAIAADPTEPDFFLVKAISEYYAGDGGNTEAAMEALHRCSLIAPQYVPMLLAKAALYSSQGNDDTALGYLNAAVATDPNDAEALFTRASVLKRLGKDALAARDLKTIMLMGDNLYDLKGLAMNEMGRDNEAFAWLQHITSTDVPGGENFYYAAVLMALRGDNYKAMEYLQKAVDNGFASRHRLVNDILSPISLQSLRSEPGFDLFIDKAQRNFMEQD